MGIEHGDAVLARIVEIDLIGADAEAADGRERRTCVDDFAGHAGFGANAQQINVFQGVDEFIFVEGALRHSTSKPWSRSDCAASG